jgi:hypothetical protein
MFSRTLAALTGAAVLACMMPAVVYAIDDPIPGVDIVVKKHPGGNAIMQTHTDANGGFTLKDLPAGHYTIEVSSKSLSATTPKTGSPIPATRTPLPVVGGKERGAPPTAGGTGTGHEAVALRLDEVLPAGRADPNGQSSQGSVVAGVTLDLTIPEGTTHSYRGNVNLVK